MTTKSIKKDDEDFEVAIGEFPILNTKLRDKAFEDIYKLVCLKAKNNKLTNWELAEQVGICSSHIGKIREAENQKIEAKRNGVKFDKSLSEYDRKLIVNAVVGRHLRNAYILAENAAKGIFPSFENHLGHKVRGTNFDFDAILKNLQRLQKIKIK